MNGMPTLGELLIEQCKESERQKLLARILEAQLKGLAAEFIIHELIEYLKGT